MQVLTGSDDCPKGLKALFCEIVLLLSADFIGSFYVIAGKTMGMYFCTKKAGQVIFT